MYRFILCFALLLISFSITGAESKDQVPTILVSVAPYKYFVEQIAGDTVNVHLMVPAGASAHTFEPTPKQMLKASSANLWFTIGESFEARAVKTLQSYNSNFAAIDLRDHVELISADGINACHHCSNPNCQDLHIWLSPRQSKKQAEHIATVLTARYPQHQDRYQAALKNFLEELDKLDEEITQTLKPLQNRLVLVSHPAYAYLCRDYGFAQLSIEFEGKDPTPLQLTRILNTARNAKIQTVFVQPQYSSKGAKLIAEKIGAKVVSLDPYSEDYLNSMRLVAKSFADGN